ncbi:MAG: hypothetical protein IKB56_07430, partial [Clostridia bacterium]|nr:hypothetical protein [Clostridia bacterium]
MAKRSKKKTGIIVGLVALLLLLALMVPLITNYDTLFGREEPPVLEENNSNDVEEETSTNVKVFFNDVELVPGEAVQSKNFTTSLKIVCDEEYEASFVANPGYKTWKYVIGEDKYIFIPVVDVLETSVVDNVATIVYPYDIMEWVLLQNEGVIQEQVTLPTDVDHNIAYVALKIVV